MIVGLLDSSLRLRDDLLRDDEDVAGLDAAGLVDRVAEQPAEVGARLDLGDSGQPDDPQVSHQGR